MLDGGVAREAVRRLLEAEQEAHEIFESAEKQTLETIRKAEEQAVLILKTAQEEASVKLRNRVGEIESSAAAEAQQCMDKWEENAREIQRRAQLQSDQAVRMVIDWVIAQGG